MGIALLGPLVVTTEAGPIALAAGKERAVLARLAIDVGRAVPTSCLVEAVWGDDPPATAVKTLQNYIARLRRVLPPAWITSEGGGYALRIDPASVDVVRFDRLVTEARGALRGGDFTLAATAFEQAFALWRGDPVPDLRLSQVGEAVVARLTELRRGAQEDAADARLACGTAADLVPELEAAVRDEPLRERRWCQLMLALYRSGRQAEALRAFQRARTALVDQLGIEPGDELRGMERAILDHDQQLLGGDAQHGRTRTDVPLPAGLALVTAGPIVGRASELARIEELWHAARHGASRVAVVHGEPGIGKTRLIGEVARIAHDDGALVLFGRCDRDVFTPYQAIVDGLRAYSRTIPRHALRRVPTWELAELARVIPEVGTPFGGEPGLLVDEPAARHRLFDAIGAFLDGQAGNRPILLAIDDLQWIDGGGAALLRHLFRVLADRLLFVGSHRSGDVDSDRRLAAMVADLAPAVAPTLISLANLGEDAVRELAGDDAPEVLAASRGSPLFVAELLRFRAATGRLPSGDEVPVGVRHAVDRRVANLEAGTLRLVEVAAVAGTAARISELAAVAGIDEADAIDLVDKAIRVHVLAERSGAPGTVTFTHDLVRASLLQTLTATRRRNLHRRMAQAILDSTTGNPGARAAEVAHHLARSAPGESDPAVVRWALTAAEHNLAQLAWETAEAHFDLALAHLPRRPSRARIDLLARLAEVNRLAGHESLATSNFAEGAALARRIGDTDRLVDLMLAWTATPVDVRRELDEVITRLRAVLDELPAADDPRHAQLWGRLAFSLAWARHPDARPIADEAVAMARRTGDPTALARTLQFSTSSRDQFEAYDPAGCAGELHGLASKLDDPRLAAQAELCWLIGCVQRGDEARTADALAALRERVERHRLIDASFRLAIVEGHLALAAGDVDAAERAADELLARAARTDLRNLFLFAAALRYDVRRAQGRLGELLPWFEHVHVSGERIARVPAMRAQVLLAAGRRSEASHALTALIADDLAAISPAERPHSVATLAEVAVELGRTDAAGVLRRELAPWAGLVVYDGTNGPLEPVDHYLARIDDALRECAHP